MLWLDLRVEKANEVRAEVGSMGGEEIRETGATTCKALFGSHCDHFFFFCELCDGEDLG